MNKTLNKHTKEDEYFFLDSKLNSNGTSTKKYVYKAQPKYSNIRIVNPILRKNYINNFPPSTFQEIQTQNNSRTEIKLSKGHANNLESDVSNPSLGINEKGFVFIKKKIKYPEPKSIEDDNDQIQNEKEKENINSNYRTTFQIKQISKRYVNKFEISIGTQIRIEDLIVLEQKLKQIILVLKEDTGMLGAIEYAKKNKGLFIKIVNKYS